VAAEPESAPTPRAPVAVDANGLPDWEDLIEKAGLRGPVRALAVQATLRGMDGATLTLALQPQYASLAVEPMTGQMQDQIAAALGRRVRLQFVSGESSADTPAARAEQARSAQQAEAERAIDDDPLVQTLKREFGARVVPQSVKPLQTNSSEHSP
jgi:DNA polymerase-3 subunit gamma/tau